MKKNDSRFFFILTLSGVINLSLNMNLSSADTEQMHILDHLSELRKKLMISSVFFIFTFIISFVNVKDIYYFFERDIDFVLNITSPGEVIWIYFSIAGIMAVAATLPVLCFQLWLFVRPGLTGSEKKFSILYVPAVFLLFIFGLVLGYFMFIKLIFPFLFSFNDGMFNDLFTVEIYFTFMFRVILPFGLLFEIPIIAVFLTNIGMLTPQFMRKIRKYAYFILIVVGAIVTPPDIVLQLSVAIPLIILYEISIYLSAIVYRKKEKKRMDYLDEDQSE